MLVSGQPGRSKNLLHWAKQSPPPVVTRPDPGDSPHPAPPVPPQQPPEVVDITPKVVSTVSIPAPTSEAPQTAARPPSLPEPPPLPAKPSEAVEVVDAALDHSSHRDRAGGRRITVSSSAKGKTTRNPVQELQKTADELAGAPGRPIRSNGGQHHAMVTPHVEASPDRPDFAKLGETIAASLVQAAREHANHASVLIEQTKQFADDIRSQVAEKSRELAELNERGGSTYSRHFHKPTTRLCSQY